MTRRAAAFSRESKLRCSAQPRPSNIYTRHALRERQLLNGRREIPSQPNHIPQLLDKKTTHMLFRLANKYRPEARKDNRLRRKAKKAAEATAVNVTNEIAIALDKNKKGKTKALDPVATYDRQSNKASYFLKYSMNHIATLAEKQRAKLVEISDDIEPPEVLKWLPIICHENNVPYAILKGSAQLGTLVNKRLTTAVAFTKVREEEKLEFSQLVDSVNACYANLNQKPTRHGRIGGLPDFKNNVKVTLRTTVAVNRLQLQLQLQLQREQQQQERQQQQQQQQEAFNI